MTRYRTLSTERIGTTIECRMCCFFSLLFLNLGKIKYRSRQQQVHHTWRAPVTGLDLYLTCSNAQTYSTQREKRSEMRHFWSSLSHSTSILSSDAGYVFVACSEQQEWATCQSPPTPHTTCSESKPKKVVLHVLHRVCLVFLFFIFLRDLTSLLYVKI